jgi:lysyl-tRNA synthetase class I
MATKAKESKKVQKVRNKLEKVLHEEHTHFNSETLREVRNTIHKWIARHEPERVSIENKTFTLFDENKHSSRTKSNYVNHLLHDLEHEQEEEGEKRNYLIGRITHKKIG